MKLSILAIAAAFALAAFAGAATADTHSIPDDDIDARMIFHGSPSGFSNAGEVDLQTVVYATDAYKEIERGRIERGTGTYWIRMEQATSQAHRAIAKTAEEEELDLVVMKGYLEDIDESIPVKDITDSVVSKLEDG